MTDCPGCLEREASIAVLREALQQIADTRYSERDEPFDDALDIADKAVSSTPASMEAPRGEWRDISTAPKDGSEIIATNWQGPDRFYSVDLIRWREYGAAIDLSWRSRNGLPAYPTHWQPLPAPPLPAREASGLPETASESESDNKDARIAELNAREHVLTDALIAIRTIKGGDIYEMFDEATRRAEVALLDLPASASALVGVVRAAENIDICYNRQPSSDPQQLHLHLCELKAAFDRYRALSPISRKENEQ